MGQNADKEDYVPGVPELISKVKQIVTFTKHSVAASDELKKVQEKIGKTEGTILKLVQDVSTRWSSTFYMIVRFLELSDLLEAVLLKFSNATMITGAELFTLKIIAKILHSFEQATAEMSAEKATTVSKVLPVIQLIKKVNCIK